MTTEVAGYYAKNTTGITSGYPYHVDRDCRGLQRSTPENIQPVTQDEIDRHRLRPCRLCTQSNAEAVLRELGVGGGGE